MSSLDVEKLLEELPGVEPCGEDLEYDAEYGEMERATEGKPEQQFGDKIIEAEPPDWKEVKRKALSLLKRTKDMRITAHLARAVLVNDGLGEFCDSVRLMRGLVERYWEEVHPRLDPEDDNDPTFRVNTLASLCDAETTLSLLREAPVVRSRALGQFSLRQIQRSEEQPEGSTDEKDPIPAMSAINAAFQDAEPEQLQGTTEAVQQAIEDVKSLEVLVTEKVGTANATSLDPLVRVLNEIREILVAQLERRGLGVPGQEEPVQETVEDPAAGAAATGAVETGGVVMTGQRLTGEVLSREDAIRALDKVCEFFERYEPSSPLPLLIRRAQRLAKKSFLEIIRDLAPDGIAQAEAIGGFDYQAGGGSSSGAGWGDSSSGGGSSSSGSSSSAGNSGSSASSTSTSSSDGW